LADRASPGRVSGSLRFDRLAAGGSHTCGVAAGSLYCWGAGSSGQLGDGGSQIRGNPTRVSGAFAQVLAGWSHTCALDPDGAAWCWGSGGSGQLGSGNYAGSQVPLRVVGDVRFGSLAR
ncbi:MAG: RCC1 domain-containing protein, partial [Longimicrobiales bacterium]|nr:RCC1 domain-containing protein [Longimicrobiales bacterium]